MFFARPYRWLLLLAILLPTTVWSQLEVTSGFPYTPENLVRTVFLGDGLEIIDVVYEGNGRSTGFFQGGEAGVGMERGILLSTGRAKGTFSQVDVENPGADLADANMPELVNGDPDLATYLGNSGVSINDIARYTIRFRPFGDSVRFRYVFASEEYPEFVCSQFNDIFGFFLSGPGINGPFSNQGINIARVPGTNLPVRINTVNGGQGSGSSTDCELGNSAFYRDNENGTSAPVFDGMTTIFVAESAVQPCEEYVMKIIIADVGDGRLDSGVFLEAKSFEGNALDLDFTNVSLDNGMAEGCRDATLTFSRSGPAPENDTLRFNVFGSATPGVDYSPLPDRIIIPAGRDQISFTMAAFDDGLAEGTEEVKIALQRTTCKIDTFTLRITDNLLTTGLLADSLIVCPGDTVSLDASLPVNFPPPAFFQSQDTVMIASPSGGYSSFIDVSGVSPESLGPNVIQSVCIDSFVHQWLDDLDLYLIGPSGQILELTTDNGGDGGNLAGEDAYINTCFTPRAIDSLTAPAQFAGPEGIPFTGEWLPEGSWEGFTSDFFTTNGRWELRVIDDSNGFTGTLYGWSITFEPVYGINYNWTPDTSLSCYDCPTPQYLGEETGTFFVTATDVYGCTLSDSIFTQFRPTPLIDAASCDMATDSSISISWGPVAEALGYELRRENGRWFSVGLNTNYTFSDLRPDSIYALYVRALFSDCPSPQVSLRCRTAPCTPPLLITNQIDPNCNEGTDGAIQISAQGGRGPLSFFLGDSLLGFTELLGLSAGNYPISVADTVGCADSVEVQLLAPPPLLATPILSRSISCFDASDGTLLANSSGGTAPYSFRWGDGVSDSIRNNLGPGEYTLSVTDANGCVDTTSITLVAPDLLALNEASVADNGCTAPSGSIEFMPTGGRQPYQYVWNIPSIGNRPDPNQLTAGIYSVTLTDVNGCQDSAQLSIGQESINIENIQLIPNDCPEAEEGVLQLSLTGVSFPLGYNWEGPDGGGSMSVSSEEVLLPTLPSGEYSISLTDDRGCEQDTSFTILTLSQLDGNAAIISPDCQAPTGGRIDWLPTNGTDDPQYAWSTGATTASIDGLGAGNYTLTVTDALGCQLERSYTVDEIIYPSLEANIRSVSCAGAGDGSISVILSDFTAPVSFHWVTPTGDTLSGASIGGLPGGDYALVGEDGNGCPLDTILPLPEPGPLRLLPFWEDIRCAGETNGLIELSAEGGTPGYRYRLLGRTEWSEQSNFINLEPGSYQAEVIDQRGCRDGSGTISLSSPSPLLLELGGLRSIPFGDSVQLFPSVRGGAGSIISYDWRAGNPAIFSCTECAAPWLRPLGQTDVQLTIMDTRGCQASSRIRLLVTKDYPVAVPTGFSPNGDGENDRLRVHGFPGVEVLSFQVFDRWGELVFEMGGFTVNDIDAGWDGQFRALPMPGGQYPWQLMVRYPDGSTERLNGITQLLR